MKTLRPTIKMLAAKGPRTVAVERTRGTTWQNIRKRVLDAQPACVQCAAAGIVTPAHPVDHIVPLWAGGTDARSNLQPLCKTCHSAKNKVEAAARARGETK